MTLLRALVLDCQQTLKRSGTMNLSYAAACRQVAAVLESNAATAALGADAAAGWQPIATAPKDGTPVLLFSPDAMYRIPALGYWLGGDVDIGAWCDYWNDRAPPIDAEPTHWMPLPAAPVQL